MPGDIARRAWLKCKIECETYRLLVAYLKHMTLNVEESGKKSISLSYHCHFVLPFMSVQMAVFIENVNRM